MPFTLEAGKFYRTRDGRKAGPMVPMMNSFDGSLVGDQVRSWRANGQHLLSETELDIIAEWRDEPEEFNPLGAVKLASLYASAKRQADALETIAASLATIARRLPPLLGTEALSERFARENPTPALNPLQPMPAYIDALNKAVKPDPGGWIEWHGGECPEAPSTRVEVRFADNTTSIREAGFWYNSWLKVNGVGIETYRLAPAR